MSSDLAKRQRLDDSAAEISLDNERRNNTAYMQVSRTGAVCVSIRVWRNCPLHVCTTFIHACRCTYLAVHQTVHQPYMP